MIVRVLWETEPVRIEEMGLTGAKWWKVRGVRFAWSDGILWAYAPAGPLPIVRIEREDHAIQFSMGYVASQQLPQLLTERDLRKGT